MKNLKIRNTILLLSATTLTFISPFTNDARIYDLNYSINSSYHYHDTTTPFASTSCGDIYVIDETLEETYKPPNDAAVVIVDKTKTDDPNIKIMESCSRLDDE